MAAGAVVIAMVFALAPDLFFGLVGKDATLTGRTKIWQAMLRQSALQPWQGYGYGAFWKLRPEGPSAWVQLQADWKVLAADNAWLDMLVQIGRVGIGLFVLTLVFFIPRAVQAIFGKGPQGYWAPLLIVTLLLTSITESVLLKQNDLTWVIYVATLAKLLQGHGDEPVEDRT
jgi:exopolysaccharide production protein ExoQ